MRTHAAAIVLPVSADYAAALAAFKYFGRHRPSPDRPWLWVIPGFLASPFFSICLSEAAIIVCDIGHNFWIVAWMVEGGHIYGEISGLRANLLSKSNPCC